MQRYPSVTISTFEDFRKCGWLSAIGECLDYHCMWQSLSNKAKKATDQERFSEAKILWLLSDACSMYLKSESINEPFGPAMVIEGKRSAIPEDFQVDDVALLAEIIQDIDNPKLCARISDITWLLTKPKNPSFALTAIDNYMKVPIDVLNWNRDGHECWERAIRLCFTLKTLSGEKLREIIERIWESFKNGTTTDGYLVLSLSDLLLKYKLGKDHQVEIANKLESMAKEFEDSGAVSDSKNYYGAAGEWYKRIPEMQKSAEMIAKVAEGWVKDAMNRLGSGSPSYMVAANLYESAIQTYRKIPRAYRLGLDIDAKIAKLKQDLSYAGKQALTEMGTVSSESIDITNISMAARNKIKGKDFLEGLFTLANIYPGARVTNFRNSSQESIKSHPMQHLFSVSAFHNDGRIVAKNPTLNLSDPIHENEEIIWSRMVKYYTVEIGIMVESCILPALETLQEEHRLKESEFYTIVRCSPIVPPGRERLLAKALFMGYDNDFVASFHILIPQIEHLVRFHLKEAGVNTTTLDINGIENENGLSTLVNNLEVNEIFGEDLAFELKALFCDSWGPNLRNELAHGLLNYEETESRHSIYTWWLVLRIVFNTFWNLQLTQQKSGV